MRRNLLLICMALISLLGANATVLPTTSTTGNDVWYYIKCSARNTPSSVWLTGTTDGNELTVSDYSGTDDQLWKIVTNGNGVAFVNKKHNIYLNTDIAEKAKLTAVTSAPSVALQLFASTKLQGGTLVISSDATVSSDQSTATGASFTFYAAGSGYNFRPINLCGYNTTTDGPGPLVHSSVIFMTQKEMLADLIKTCKAANTTNNAAMTQIIAEAQAVVDNQSSTETDYKNTYNKLAVQNKLYYSINQATVLYEKSSIGEQPGQFSSETMSAFEEAINTAKNVLVNTNLTQDDYNASINELNMMVGLFRTASVTPKLDDESWYYIQGTRPSNTYLTTTGSEAEIKDLALVPNDTQLWKFIKTGSGFVLKNKATEEYLDCSSELTPTSDGVALFSTKTIPTKALKLTASNETSNKVFLFWIENAEPTINFRLHAGNGNAVMNWTGDANQFSSWLIVSLSELKKNEFRKALSDVKDKFKRSVAGNILGQLSTDDHSKLSTAISTAEALDLSIMSDEEIDAAKNNILSAIENINCITDVKTVVSNGNFRWFRIVNNADLAYARNKVISSNGRSVGQKFTYEILDVNSDAQLFRFEMDATQSKVTNIINKATGLYMGADGTMLAAAEVGTEFEISPLTQLSFWIKPTTADPIHAQETGAHIVNWESGAGSASDWKIEFVKDETITDYSSIYLKTRTNARQKYDESLPFIGEEFSQYSSAGRTAFNSVIASEEAKDATTLTNDQMKEGIASLNNALAAYKINTDIKALVSTEPNKYKWFRFINAANTDVAYVTGKAMSSNGRAENDKFTFENKDDASDAQLFRFELNAGQTNILNIINKANGLYLGADGTIQAASTPDNEYAITQLAGGRSFWIDPTLTDYAPLHAQESGSLIVNWEAGAGSASAWNIEFVKEETTAVSTIKTDKYTIHSTNGIITVDGVKHFEVYSVIGQKQNIKTTLKKGVYFVKINNNTSKIVVE